MTYEQKTTHVEEGLANLISQFEDKDDVKKLLTVFLKQVQSLEDAFATLILLTALDVAEGEQLDNIGELVGERRESRTDALYKTAIEARILLNKSEGTLEDVVEIALAVAKATVGVTTTEYYPAGFIMDINGDIDTADVDVGQMAKFIGQARPAAVQGVLTYHVAGSFQYDGPADTGFDEGKYGAGDIA